MNQSNKKRVHHLDSFLVLKNEELRSRRYICCDYPDGSRWDNSYIPMLVVTAGLHLPTSRLTGRREGTWFLQKRQAFIAV
jgi:hypothetical protein